MKHFTLPTLLAVKRLFYLPCRPKTAKTLRLVKCVLGKFFVTYRKVKKLLELFKIQPKSQVLKMSNR